MESLRRIIQRLLLLSLTLGALSISGGDGQDTNFCQPEGFSKVLLNQTQGGQYIEYVTEVPELTGFTIHYWVQILEQTELMPTFSYLAEGEKGKDYVQVTLLRIGEGWYSILQVKGVVVSNTRLPEDFFGEWHHLLHSWDSESGIWSIYIDGNLAEEGESNMSKGLIVKGGGRVFTGQQASTVINNSVYTCGEIASFKEGLDGWITLMNMDTRAIKQPRYWINRMAVAVVAAGCRAEHKGDVVSWLETPRRSFCGVLESRANRLCGAF